MLHACGWDASLRPAFAAWAQQRRAFWTEIADRSALAPALIDCGWWHGYVIAELAYSMALNQVTPYRMLRRLCLQRLCAGGVAMAADAVQGKLFSLLLDQMLYGGDGSVSGSAGEAGEAAPQAAADEAAAAEGSAAGVRAGRAADWPAQAARACGIQLAAQGIDGLSHRAIAAQIGIPHTTLSYRFPTQHDLVIAGLEAIAAHILSAVDAGSLTVLQRMLAEGDGPKLDLARANFAVAIATMRMPELTAYTANMRSRRGNNLVKVFKQTMPGARGLDALCAQIVSMGLTGLTNTQPPGQACDAAVASAFSAVASWLGQQQSQ
jgi:AcrR family transcriptional regulator